MSLWSGMIKILTAAANQIRHRMGWALGGFATVAIAASALILSDTAPAATVAVTPDTINEVLVRARDGDTIRLSPGDYGSIQLKRRKWAPAITIDASDAKLVSVRLDTVSGLHWRGGHFDGSHVERGGFAVFYASKDINIEAASFTGFIRYGIAVDQSSDIGISGNTFSDSGSDGIDIGQSRRITIEGNDCRDFEPTAQAHPDCIQMWSRATNPPTADVIIRNNIMHGKMQGISLFNHIRDGADDGGFDRITIIGNDVAISGFYHGIAAFSCRSCLIRDNKVTTLPSANPKIRAWLRVDGDDKTQLCANVVSAFPGTGGDRRCKPDVPMAIARP